MIKIDRQLIQVDFITWEPWTQEGERNGTHDKNNKIKMSTFLWAPVPLSYKGGVDASLSRPEDQGMLWAQNEVIRLKPDGREVLAIIGASVILSIPESMIANQPVDPKLAELAMSIERAQLVT